MKRNKLHIHWYPGHIAKAEKKLKEQLSFTDTVIEVIDARLPFSTSYNNITRLLSDKPRLILLNKSDLTDKNELQAWISLIEKKTGCSVVATDAKNSSDIQSIIKKLTELSEPKMQTLISKGLLRRAARVMVVGMPNVGKSSIINKLTKSSKTKTGAKAGVTRNQQWVRINPQLELLDTPGIIPMKQENQDVAQKLAFVNSVSENAYSSELVAEGLLELLNVKYEQAVKDHYKTEALTLESIALSRNWLITGGNPDIERTSAYILKDFRSGKIGKFILDDIKDYE